MSPLERLRRLNQSSPEFADHLTSLFHEPGYIDCVASLQDDNPACLVEYIDNVRLCASFTSLPPRAE